MALRLYRWNSIGRYCSFAGYWFSSIIQYDKRKDKRWRLRTNHGNEKTISEHVREYGW